MLDALDITEEEAQGLADIARHDLELARDFARRALACEDNDEACRLARSYQRAARSYRQTLAVKARLKRDLAQAQAAIAQVQAGTPRPKPGGAAIARRIGELREALLRLSWDEAERPEDEMPDGSIIYDSPEEAFADSRQSVELVITEECLKATFCDEPLDDHVARLALGMGFRPAEIARWRDLPDPPKAALAYVADDDWLSSA
jgi:hypothetical protein